jgi:hypothetical protein
LNAIKYLYLFYWKCRIRHRTIMRRKMLGKNILDGLNLIEKETFQHTFIKHVLHIKSHPPFMEDYIYECNGNSSKGPKSLS